MDSVRSFTKVETPSLYRSKLVRRNHLDERWIVCVLSVQLLCAALNCKLIDGCSFQSFYACGRTVFAVVCIDPRGSVHNCTIDQRSQISIISAAISLIHSIQSVSAESCNVCIRSATQSARRRQHSRTLGRQFDPDVYPSNWPMITGSPRISIYFLCLCYSNRRSFCWHRHECGPNERKCFASFANFSAAFGHDIRIHKSGAISTPISNPSVLFSMKSGQMNCSTYECGCIDFKCGAMACIFFLVQSIIKQCDRCVCVVWEIVALFFWAKKMEHKTNIMCENIRKIQKAGRRPSKWMAWICTRFGLRCMIVVYSCLGLHLVCTSADHIVHGHGGNHCVFVEFTDDLRWCFATLSLDQFVVVFQRDDALHLASVQRFLVELFAQLEVDFRVFESGRGDQCVVVAASLQLDGWVYAEADSAQEPADTLNGWTNYDPCRTRWHQVDYVLCSGRTRQLWHVESLLTQFFHVFLEFDWFGVRVLLALPHGNLCRIEHIRF